MANNENDIAALEKKIKRLEKENQQLKNIIFKAPIPIFVVDKAHRITHFNQALEELTGLDARDMIGTKEQWKAFYSSQRPVMADLIIERSSDAEIVEHYGLKYKRSFGNKERFAATDFFKDMGKSLTEGKTEGKEETGKWLFFTASTFSDQDGDIAGAVETLQDVTEEKTAERKTREIARIHRKILEFVPYPIVVYDERGDVSYLNPSFTSTFGWTPEDLLGGPVPFVPEALQEETDALVSKFMEDKSLTRYETQRLTKDGSVLDVVLWAASHSLSSQSGQMENFVLLRNITEEKRIEANNQSIMRISAALPEHPELEDLMDYISKEIRTLLNVEGAVVILYDEIKEELFSSGVSYDDAATEIRAKRLRTPVDSLLAGEIVKTGRYIMENDVENLKKNYPERDKQLGYETRSLLEYPIKSDGRIIGVLCAINKKQNLFNQNDLELMAMIAGTCAISIENARFSEAVREAYRDVASMNRAKGKAINHLSHELKTPVAILTGSLQILEKKLKSVTGIKVDTTLRRVERNLERIVDIQDEVADIMKDKTYSARKLLLKMFETCQDELETLILQNKNADDFEDTVRQMIDQTFGPRAIHFVSLDLHDFFNGLYAKISSQFEFRDLSIQVAADKDLPLLVLPEEILEKILSGLVKNGIENTPDKGKIRINMKKDAGGVLFRIRDYGVGIEEDAQKRIFEGFFTTQETLSYSTKSPFAFNAGGKGADLLRMKIFSDRHGFTLEMDSKRCCYLMSDREASCIGDIEKCPFCQTRQDCFESGYTLFSVHFPSEKK